MILVLCDQEEGEATDPLRGLHPRHAGQRSDPIPHDGDHFQMESRLLRLIAQVSIALCQTKAV